MFQSRGEWSTSRSRRTGFRGVIEKKEKRKKGKAVAAAAVGREGFCGGDYSKAGLAVSKPYLAGYLDIYDIPCGMEALRKLQSTETCFWSARFCKITRFLWAC